jgi:hypothetical protein
VPIWRPATPADRVTAERAVLQGVLRLRINATQHPKVTAIPGTRLGLLPPPAWTSGDRVLLVEGPSDMLAARSAGLPAVAVPGANAWRSEWAGDLEGRAVVVVMDCDRPGRQAAARIAEDLEYRGIAVWIGDLAPSRRDGYDVSDWLREGNPPPDLLRPRELRSASGDSPMTGPPAPVAAAASRPPGPQERMAGAAERPLGTRRRSAGCTTFS